MNTISTQLEQYFQKTPQFNIVHRATNPTNPNDDIHLLTYLNLIRPHAVHILYHHEIAYLQKLSTKDQSILIERLSINQAQCLIFQNQHDIPGLFYQQNKLHLVIDITTNNFLYSQLHNALYDHIAQRINKHGAFVVLNGLGILITGCSGTGKSSLLLSLINRGHRWVADDSLLFFLNANNQIVGHATEALSEFIHVKGIGPIDMDKSFGLSCRLRSHTLAAVVELSDNTLNENKNISVYTQSDSATLLGKKIPMRRLSSTHQNLALMVESFVNNLILSDWNRDPSAGLENALNNILST